MNCKRCRVFFLVFSLFFPMFFYRFRQGLSLSLSLTLLHRSKLNILAKNQFKNSAIFMKFSNNLQILQICKICKKLPLKIHQDNLVDFEQCCKTHIYSQRSAPIQPRTNEILPQICQKLATTLRASLPGPCRTPS